MLFHPKYDDPLAGLAERVQLAHEVTPDLLADVVAACSRSTAIPSAPRARIARLVGASAWTEAALALLETELPQWSVRSLARDDGEWLCCLSPYPSLPIELDDTVDARHEILPLAVLAALVEARRRIRDGQVPSMPVSRCNFAADHAVCCDDFA